MCDPLTCQYQFYHGHRGPSLEVQHVLHDPYERLGANSCSQYEICSNPETVDLLVSLAYHAATVMALDPRPTGLGLYVPRMDPSSSGVYYMRSFDELSVPEVRRMSLSIVYVSPDQHMDVRCV